MEPTFTSVAQYILFAGGRRRLQTVSTKGMDRQSLCWLLDEAREAALDGSERDLCWFTYLIHEKVLASR